MIQVSGNRCINIIVLPINDLKEKRLAVVQGASKCGIGIWREERTTTANPNCMIAEQEKNAIGYDIIYVSITFSLFIAQ